MDDEWLLRWRARELLEGAGYQVVEAANADEALKILGRRADIALLFTDINMPGSLDGLQLAHEVHKRYPFVKLLITSGKVAPARESIPEEGVFISKPYSAESVVRHL
ncbi:MAG TPA: response regulator [Rhizomicrobium sp.]